VISAIRASGLGIISAAGKSLWICRRNNSRCGPVQVRSGHSI
jgi:hypothetical protein